MIIIGHNLVTDLTQLVRAGYRLPDATYFDTQVASQWLYSDQLDHSLEHLALRMTNMPHWRKTLGKLKLEDFEKMDEAELQQRCGRDAEAALRLYPILNREIGTNEIRKIWNLAMNVLPILAEMGGRGMAVNLKELKKRTREVGRWLTKEKAALESTLGISNLDSHQQLATALYGPFGAIPLHKTTQGYSSDRKSLMWARYQARQKKQQDLDTLLTRILEYGTQSKIHSTYYQGWLENLGTDIHIHSFYSLGRTSTGRLASFQTNLQNVPDIARELVVPSPGYDSIVAADYCLGMGVRVLTGELRWQSVETLRKGDLLVGFDEQLGKDARIRPSLVESVKKIRRPSYRIQTTHGAFIASAEHLWVCTRRVAYQRRDRPWKEIRKKRIWVKTSDLRVGDRLASWIKPWEEDTFSYEAGFLAGFFEGEGCVTSQLAVQFSQNIGPSLDKACELLRRKGFEISASPLKTTRRCISHTLCGNRAGLRFIGMVRPPRLLEKACRELWKNRRIWGSKYYSVIVEAIEAIGDQEVIAVQTSTRTLLAEGILSHNSQLEWRVAAHISQDPTMRQWLREGKDAHSITAARSLGLPEPHTHEDFAQFKTEHKIERATGKMTNFAVMYGVSADSLAWQIFRQTDGNLWIPPLEIQHHINTFFETFPKYRQYISDLWYALHRREWIACPTGFRWQLPPTPEGWRQAQNYPVQRLASDLTLIGLLALVRELRKRRMKSRLIGEVHDSVVLEAPKRELADLCTLLTSIFEHPNTKPFGFTLSVPLAVEVTAGETWADLKEIR